jgi:hypothetical protein
MFEDGFFLFTSFDEKPDCGSDVFATGDAGAKPCSGKPC